MLDPKCVGDTVWMLVSRHYHRQLGTNIKYKSPTSPSGELWCWWPMLVPQALLRWHKFYWIMHQVEFHISNITDQSLTSHSGILWCWWPIGMSATCRKMSPTYFFVISIFKWSPSLSHQHNYVTNITVTMTYFLLIWYRSIRWWDTSWHSFTRNKV